MLLWRGRLALANGAAARPLGAASRCSLLAAGLTLLVVPHAARQGAGVTLLVVLMALKTLELRARRDAFVVFFLGFFLVLTHFLYSQSLLVALAMLVSVWGLLTALVLAHMPVGRPSLRQAGALAARTALIGTPVMVAAVPAVPAHRRRCGACRRTASATGLSNTCAWARWPSSRSDDSIALRLRFDGPPPPPQALYFRGPVLTRFDGHDWRRSALSPCAAGAPRARRRAADARPAGRATR